jgi:hypothetical protein
MRSSDKADWRKFGFIWFSEVRRTAGEAGRSAYLWLLRTQVKGALSASSVPRQGEPRLRR